MITNYGCSYQTYQACFPFSQAPDGPALVASSLILDASDLRPRCPSKCLALLFFQDPVNVYMLLSYVPGGELFSHLRRAGRFTPDVTRFYLSSIILAIACASSVSQVIGPCIRIGLRHNLGLIGVDVISSLD